MDECCGNTAPIARMKAAEKPTNLNTDVLTAGALLECLDLVGYIKYKYIPNIVRTRWLENGNHGNHDLIRVCRNTRRALILISGQTDQTTIPR